MRYSNNDDLQEVGKGDEINKSHHWNTIDPVNKKYGNIKCYVDAEFAVHKGMMIHTGVFMTMGTGRAHVNPVNRSEHQEFN